MSKRGFKATAPKPTITAQPAKKQERLKIAPIWILAGRSVRLSLQNITAILLLFVLPLLLQVFGHLLVGDLTRFDQTVIIGIMTQVWAAVILSYHLNFSQLWSLRAVRGERPKIISIYRDGLRFLPRVGGALAIIGNFIFISLIAFIIPGLIVLRRYVLTAFFLVDGDTGIREAMIRSAAATKPWHVRKHVWSLLLFYVLMGIVDWLLLAFLGLFGQIAAILLFASTLLVPALLYQEILKLQPESASPEK